ncbi:MAG: glycoside hydrolase family 172 protein [Anaerolineae bacterium]
MFNSYPLYELPKKVEARWINPENISGAKGMGGRANGGRKGSPCYGELPAGAELILADYSGSSGILRHIWTTIDQRTPEMLRGLRIAFYWDGAEKPAIETPYGDFFGIGLGELVPFENAMFTSPEGRNFNSFIPMPFRSGFKITIQNTTAIDVAMFWFQVDFTIYDELGPDTLYLHATFQHQNPTVVKRDYEFLPLVHGRGRFLGVNFGVQADTGEYFRSWWGEGEVKIYLDGDTDYPTLCGTGTEDYILSAWEQGEYNTAYAGCTLADHTKLRFCFYRYHVLDPIYFRQEIRATIQQIGAWFPETRPSLHQSGKVYLSAEAEPKELDLSPEADILDYGLFERADDWSSCAYFYLDRAAI